jgi:hypothetical protein
MAKNTRKGYREGEVRDRSQVFNPVTKKWTKRDSDTGEFMDVKEDGQPFKGIRKEK